MGAMRLFPITAITSCWHLFRSYNVKAILLYTVAKMTLDYHSSQPYKLKELEKKLEQNF